MQSAWVQWARKQVGSLDAALYSSRATLLSVPSVIGSGKSSLLQIVHGDGRYLKHVQGEVLVNGTSIKAIHNSFRCGCLSPYTSSTQTDAHPSIRHAPTWQEDLLSGPARRHPPSGLHGDRDDDVLGAAPPLDAPVPETQGGHRPGHPEGPTHRRLRRGHRRDH